MRFYRSYSLCITLAIVLLMAAYPSFAQERSEDRDKPTPVTANEITDDLDGGDDEYFYVFTVGPGTLKITFDVDASGSNAGATFDFFDTRSKSVLSNVLVQGVDKGSERVIKSLKSAKRRDIVMRVKGIKYGSSGGNGTYKVRLEGPLILQQAETPAPGPGQVIQ